MYGSSVAALTVVGGLLGGGLAGSRVVLAQACPSLNNSAVEEKVCAAVEGEGVRVCRQCKLEGWREEGGKIAGVDLAGPEGVESISCEVCFACWRTSACLSVCLSVCQSVLVSDRLPPGTRLSGGGRS